MNELFLYFFVIALVVFIHEVAHAATARSLGVRVSGVSVFFGPELLGFTDRRGCRWSLRLIPLGGFAKIPDFDEIAPSKSFLIALAGPTASLAVPIVALGLLVAIVAGPIEAAKIVGSLFFLLCDMAGNMVGSILNLSFVTSSEPISAGGKLASDVKNEFGFATIPILAFLISITLGVINLLPIPPLDGGRMLISGLEIVLRRRLSETTKVVLILPGILLILSSFAVSIFREFQDLVLSVVGP